MNATDEAVRQFESVCQFVVNRYFLPPGLSRDDLLQEARIGLMKALRTYEPGHGASLKTFVNLAVEAEVITAIRAATRQKHGPLNHAITEVVGGDGEEESILNLIEDDSARPDRVLEAADEMTLIDVAMKRADLSEQEAQCLTQILEGGTYSDVALELGVSEKTVDNALQRVRRKLVRVGGAMSEAA